MTLTYFGAYHWSLRFSGRDGDDYGRKGVTGADGFEKS